MSRSNYNTNQTRDDTDAQHHGRWTATSEARDLNTYRDDRRSGPSSTGSGPSSTGSGFFGRSQSDRDVNDRRDRDYNNQRDRDSSDRRDQSSFRRDRDFDRDYDRDYDNNNRNFGYNTTSDNFGSGFGSNHYGSGLSSTYGSGFGSGYGSSYGSGFGSSFPSTYGHSSGSYYGYPHSTLYGSYGGLGYSSYPHHTYGSLGGYGDYSTGRSLNDYGHQGYNQGHQIRQQQTSGADHLGYQHRSHHRRPETDVYELGNDYIVELDLPGHSQEHIETKLYGNDLVILSRPPRREHDFHMNERSLGRHEVQRRLVLPSTADATKIKAALSNGVLRVTIPKTSATTLPLTSGSSSNLTGSTQTGSTHTGSTHTAPRTVVTTDSTTTTTDVHRA